MAFNICLQAGHININSNCLTSLRPLTGAPGEQELNQRIQKAVSQKLIERGFNTKLVDANFNCNDERVQDFDLFIAIHGDADYGGNEGGGFVDYPDPEVDSATIRSKACKEAIEGQYFNHSGIKNVPSRSNPHTKYYYMWQYLSALTPCVLIELGEVQDPHDKVILADTERVANALVRGICSAFNIPFEIQTPIDPCLEIKSRLNELQQVIDGLNKQVESEKKFDEDLARTLGVANQQSDILGEVARLISVEDQLRVMTHNFNESQTALTERENIILKMKKDYDELKLKYDELVTTSGNMREYYDKIEQENEKLKLDIDIIKKQKEIKKSEIIKEIIRQFLARFSKGGEK
jgi:hypothetical protein